MTWAKAHTLVPGPTDIPNAWIYTTQIVDRAGHALTAQYLAGACPLLGTGGPPDGGRSSRGPVPGGAQQALQDCVAKVGATYHEVTTYQPGSRYWLFQSY